MLKEIKDVNTEMMKEIIKVQQDIIKKLFQLLEVDEYLLKSAKKSN